MSTCGILMGVCITTLNISDKKLIPCVWANSSLRILSAGTSTLAPALTPICWFRRFYDTCLGLDVHRRPGLVWDIAMLRAPSWSEIEITAWHQDQETASSAQTSDFRRSGLGVQVSTWPWASVSPFVKWKQWCPCCRVVGGKDWK